MKASRDIRTGLQNGYTRADPFPLRAAHVSFHFSG